MIAVSDLQTKLQSAGLPAPPIPPEFEAKIKELSEWIFGTRPLDARPYNIEAFVDEVLAGPVEDYLVVAHDGYGINNWALHYYLKLDHLALFLQLPWGGAYDDDDRDILTARIASAFRGVDQYLSRLGTAIAAGRTLPGALLVVVQSSITEPRWAWTNPGTPVTWTEEQDNALRPAFDSIPA